MKTAWWVALGAVVVLCCTRYAGAAVTELKVAGVDIRADIDASAFRHGSAPLETWITRSAEIVASYYARFPTTSLRVRVVPEDGDGVRSGKTFGYNGGFIRVQVGQDVTE